MEKNCLNCKYDKYDSWDYPCRFCREWDRWQGINRKEVANMIDVKIVLNEGAKMPSYAKEGDSGVDLFCYEDVLIKANSLGNLIPTGVKIELPKGYELQVRPKSGNSIKTSLRVVIGTVDEGYRGEIGIIVDNLSDKDILIAKGKAIAQGVLQQVPKINFIEVNDLSNSERGQGGFGSSNRGV